MKSVFAKVYLFLSLIFLAAAVATAENSTEPSSEIPKEQLWNAVLGIESQMRKIYAWEEKTYEPNIPISLYATISEKEAFEAYKKLADSGDLSAQYAVSLCYENALGVKTSRKNAVAYLEKAMEKQYAPAISRYCELIVTSRSITTTDAKVAVQILANSLASRYADSYRVLSMCYRMGFGVKNDNKIATDLLEKAKQAKGADIAQLDKMLADIYLSMYQDDKTKSDYYNKALHYYDESAHYGDTEAMYTFAIEFPKAAKAAYWYKKYKKCESERSQKELERKETLFPYWLTRAEKGDSSALYNLADFFDPRGITRTPSLEKSVYYRKKAADAGSEKACYDIYLMYLSGDGVAQNFAEAKKYRKKCAEYGGNLSDDLKRIDDEKALKALESKETKIFTPSDYEGDENIELLYEAAVLYYLSDANTTVENWKAVFPYVEKAALKGNATALCLLGDIYYNGLGVDGDTKKGLHYYRISASLLNEDAMLKIAECYEDGINVAFDADEAMAWYMMAALRGNSAAEEVSAFYDELHLLSESSAENVVPEIEEEWWTEEDDSEEKEAQSEAKESGSEEEEKEEKIDWATFGEPTVLDFDNAADFAYDVAVMESPESVALLLLSSKMLSLPDWSAYCATISDGERQIDAEAALEALWNEKIAGADDLAMKIFGNTFNETENGGTLVINVSGTAFTGEFSTDYALDFVHTEDSGYLVAGIRELDFAYAYYLYIGLLLNTIAQ